MKNLRSLILMLALPAFASPPVPAFADTAPDLAAMRAVLDVQTSALRSQKGVVRFCLTRKRQYFPDCTKDPAARHLNITASDAHEVRFSDLPYGIYALSLIHDENNNGKLDTRLGIPREGFGFSNNPVVLFGPPSFRVASFTIDSPNAHRAIKIRYMF